MSPLDVLFHVDGLAVEEMIVVDLEKHRPVDLLPDRTAEVLAAWLRDHPGVETISRDRGGSYAEGAKQGAPTPYKWPTVSTCCSTLAR